MTAGGPAGALLQTHSVVGPADEEPATRNLLEMTLQAEVRIAFGKHFRIHRTVGGVTDRAAFAQRRVLEGNGAALRRVAAETAFVFGNEGSAAAEENRTFMGRMAIGAAHLALGDRMVAREAELGANIAMALVTDGFN